MSKKKNRMQWHPACYAALNLEFKENKQDLEILQEQPINKLPLRVDALIIKKNQKSSIKNEIGKLFREYNLIEYKSPDSELNFDVFIKGIALSYLYKVNNYKMGIQPEHITLTFIRDKKPANLFETLSQYNFAVNEIYKGIYYITGKSLVLIQIVVTEELSVKNHIWIKALTKKLSRERVEELVIVTNKLTDSDDKKFADEVWEIVTQLNRKIIEAMRKENFMCKAMAEIFKPEIDAAVELAVQEAVAAAKDTAFNDGFNDGIDDKGIQIFKKMIKKGFSLKEAQELTDISDVLVEKALAQC